MTKPKLVVQPTSFTCTHACLAMVTRHDVYDIIARYGNRPLGWQSEVAFLVENYIFPLEVSGNKVADYFDLQGLYLASVPSLNLPGEMHRVVVFVDVSGPYLMDPNRGREGVMCYEPLDVQAGRARVFDVAYLDMHVLQELKSHRYAASTEEHF